MRKIDQNEIITTIIGNGHRGFNGDGQLATSTSLACPTGVFQYENEIYIADNSNRRIRKIDQNGITSTISGNEENSLFPHSVFVRHDGVYFTDIKYLYVIFTNGMIRPIAGIENETGVNEDNILASECKLRFPKGIYIDNDSQIYIADTCNHCIRKIDRNGMMRRVIEGYSGDVPFDFKLYPHFGPPRKKQLIKPFPHALYDLIVICGVGIEFNNYEPVSKKIKHQ